MNPDFLLTQLGFTKNLSRIYLTLLRLGKCRAGVVLRETGLQRSVVYNGLEELATRGLVSKIVERGVALFSPNDPESLVEEIENKKRIAAKASEELRKYQGASNREAVVFEGADIIERVAEKSLETENGKTIYFLGPSKFGIQANMERFWKKFHTQRIAKGIQCKILYDKDTPAEVLATRNATELCQAKYMPFGVDLPFWLVIFENHVAMVVPGDEPPLAFVIKSEKTAQGFEKYFEYLWQAAKE